MVSKNSTGWGISYFGFVYVWYNRNSLSSKHKKHPRLYIGSHYGPYDDGYVCSSKWMKASYKRCPSNFIRRIVYWQRTPDKLELLDKEQEWLDLIEQYEYGTRFYNLTKKASCFADTKEIREKIAATLTGRKLPPDHIEAIRQAHLARPEFTEEHRANISKSAKIRAQNAPPATEERKQKTSAALIKYNKGKIKEIKQCLICEEEFLGDYRQKYCSLKCQRRNEYLTHTDQIKARAARHRYLREQISP